MAKTPHFEIGFGTANAVKSNSCSPDLLTIIRGLRSDKNFQREYWQGYYSAVSPFNVSEAVDHYITAMLFGSTDESTPQGGEPLDKNYNASHLVKLAYQKCRLDVIRFLAENQELLLQCIKGRKGCKGYADDVQQIAHDFWFTRSHDGVGFWEADHCTEAQGEALTVAAQNFGEVWPYVYRKRIYID